MSDEGANLTVAEDGLQAVRMFQEKPEGYFDAILMDIMMPVMDGITATKTIRSLKHPDAETIPIIAMTANAFREDKEKCLPAGLPGFLLTLMGRKKKSCRHKNLLLSTGLLRKQICASIM